MKELRGPYPEPAYRKRMAAEVMAPIILTYSGELKVTIAGGTAGAFRTSAKVQNAWVSVGASGKDDSNTLSVEGDLYINGVSVFTTKPKIAHVSGEASQQKTTIRTGDTGITQAVMGSSRTGVPGDVLTYNFNLVRTATPTTEISAVAMVVEFEPVI